MPRDTAKKTRGHCLCLALCSSSRVINLRKVSHFPTPDLAPWLRDWPEEKQASGTERCEVSPVELFETKCGEL